MKTSFSAGVTLVAVVLAAGTWRRWFSESPAALSPALDPSANLSSPRDGDPPQLSPRRPVTRAAGLVARAAGFTRGGPDVPLWRPSPDELAACWENEQTDSEWTGNLEGMIYALLEPEDLERTIIRSTDCRKTVCRIVFNTEGTDQALLRLRAAFAREDVRFARRDVEPRQTEVFVLRELSSEALGAAQPFTFDTTAEGGSREMVMEDASTESILPFLMGHGPEGEQQ